MTADRGRFRSDELSGADEPVVGDADMARALSAARALEGLTERSPSDPGADFVDRVMAAVEREPAPSATAALAVVRGRPRLGTFAASVRAAWALAFAGVGRPIGARAAALGYVLVVAVLGASLTGAAVYGAAGALGLFDDRSPVPSEPAPTVDPSVGPTLEPSVMPTPSGSPGPTVEPSATTEPDKTGAPSASPGASGAPTSDPSGTPETSASPDPSDSPEPSDTPDPSGSGGSGPG